MCDVEGCRFVPSVCDPLFRCPTLLHFNGRLFVREFTSNDYLVCLQIAFGSRNYADSKVLCIRVIFACFFKTCLLSIPLCGVIVFCFVLIFGIRLLKSGFCWFVVNLFQLNCCILFSNCFRNALGSIIDVELVMVISYGWHRLHNYHTEKHTNLYFYCTTVLIQTVPSNNLIRITILQLHNPT